MCKVIKPKKCNTQKMGTDIVKKKGRFTKKLLRNLRVVRWFSLLFSGFQIRLELRHNLQLKKKWNLAGCGFHERSWVFDRYPSVYSARAVLNSFAVWSTRNLHLEERQSPWNPLVLVFQRPRVCQDRLSLGLDRREHLGTLQFRGFWRQPEIQIDEKIMWWSGNYLDFSVFSRHFENWRKGREK